MATASYTTTGQVTGSAVDGGTAYSLALRSDGTVWSWGLNSAGQLGDGTTTQRLSPVFVAGLTGIKAVSAGGSHSLALRSDGTVWSWGFNQSGQLGDGTTANQSSPIQVTALSGVVAISAGDSHSLAVTSNGTIWAWGYNQSGQLGDGTTTQRPSPVTVASGGLAVAAGSAHSLLLKGDGSVWAWGSNSSGQLGDGTTANHLVPGAVDGMTGVIRVGAGGTGSEALRNDGTIWGWGAFGGLLPTQAGGVSTAIALATGSSHSLALKSGGTVLGWGSNSSGQVGDGTTMTRPTAVSIPGLSGIVAVGAGSSHSLAVQSDGTIWAWGSNSGGQVGDGTTANALAPVKITEANFATKVGTPTVSVVPGTYTTTQSVALASVTPSASIYYTTDGSTPTTGSNAYGSAISVGQTTTIKAKAFKAGLADSNVVTATYTLQVVTPTFTPAGGSYGATQSVAISTTTTGTSIYYTTDGSTPTTSSAQYSSAVAVNTSLTLKAIATKTGWLSSNVGSATYTLNLGTLAAPTISPSSGTFVGSVNVTLSAAAGASIYYTTNGTTPTTSSTLYASPFALTQTSTVKAIAVKANYTNSPVGSATLTVQAVAPTLSLATGTYAAGQQVTVSDTDATVTIRYTTTGTDPTATDQAIATGTVLTLEKGFTLKAAGFKTGCVTSAVVSAVYTVTGALSGGRVGAGSKHSTAIPTDNTAWTWGKNTNGQLGIGTTVSSSIPVQISSFAATRVIGGLSHTVALKADGTVWAWGLNTNGQVGDNTTTQRTAPVQVLTAVAGIAVGSKHSLAVKTNGTVWAWGYNFNGQLGDGTTVQKLVPTQITALTGTYIAVAAGVSHSLALKSDGTVYAWGLNGNGQLGDSTTSQRTSPVVVTGLSSVTALAAGAAHSVALQGTGAILAWGLNSSGQVGDGTNTQRLSPTSVATIAGALSIAAGDNHSLAVGPDGSAWAWGANGSGQLGDGTNSNRNKPVASGVPTGVVSVAGGTTHSLAARSDGSVWAWGDNSDGQIGDGTSGTGAGRWTPVQVAGPGFTWTVGMPMLNPPGGSYTASQSVVVTCATPGATIRYTTNGIDPTTTDTTVASGGTVAVGQSLTLKAKAWKGSSPSSAVASEVYVLTVPPPTASVGTGTYNLPQTVTLSSAVGGTIYYTTDGSTPTTSSAVYSGAIAINATTTLKALTALAGWTTSALTTKVYTLVAADPALSPVGGTFATAQTVTLTDTTPAVEIHYSLNGLEPGPIDPKVSSGGTVLVSSSSTLKAKAFRTGWTASNAVAGTFMITGVPAATPTMSPAPGTFTTPQTVTFVTTTPGATIRYTTDGTDPVLTSKAHGTPVVVNGTLTLKAKAFVPGLAPSAIATGVYTINLPGVAAPSLSPGPGRYATTRNVVVTCATAGATIRYTTNGVDPTATDPVVASGGTVVVDRSMTLKVKATKSGLADSPVQRGDYLVVGAIASGTSHNLALKANGTVWAWGLNNQGQLGDGTTANRSTPVQVLTGAMAIAAGGSHSLAVKSDGTVWSWGWNSQGQLGDNTTTNHWAPIQVQGLTSIVPVAVAAGDRHSLVLTSTGTVLGWGYNSYGQVGDGTVTTPRKLPVAVSSLTGAAAIVAGNDHSLSLKSDGTVAGWGYNGNGQVGDGTTVNRSAPVLLPLSGIAALSASVGNSAALKTDGAQTGAVWNWGRNESGQLGNGTTSTNPNPLPAPLSGVFGLIGVAQGTDHGAALRLDAIGTTSVLGWGDNSFGQIGDGLVLPQRLRPIPVIGFGGVLALDAGTGNSLTLRSDGTVWDWGQGNYGQLGNGATASSTVPVQANNLVLSDPAWLLADPDNDGLVTIAEVLLGTDPYSADSNGDGILDGAELKAGKSATNTDIDADGLSNAIELQRGTDPFNPDTDGDGVGDGQDCFPLDPTRWQCPPPVGGDTTPPVITLTEPTSAQLISSVP